MRKLITPFFCDPVYCPALDSWLMNMGEEKLLRQKYISLVEGMSTRHLTFQEEFKVSLRLIELVEVVS